MEADTNTGTRPDPELLVLSGQRRLLAGKVRASLPASAAEALDVRAKLKFTFRLMAPEAAGYASSGALAHPVLRSCFVEFKCTTGTARASFFICQLCTYFPSERTLLDLVRVGNKRSGGKDELIV